MKSGFLKKIGFLPHFACSLALAAFFLGFTLLYNPFGIKAYYTFGEFNFGFHLVMLSCIVLVCALISRLILYVLLRRRDAEGLHDAVWCLAEAVVISFFVALYTLLFKGDEGGYFDVLGDCFKFVTCTLFYPYAFIYMIGLVKTKNEELERKEKASDNSLIKFYDEHKRLKLSVAPSAILYVKSEFNYVKIHYLDAGKVKKYMLRTSMKSLAEIDSKCLVRCQRSYFVNPEHVTVLRKDAEGFIYAEMNIPDVPAVPVSKQYYATLAALL
ncbi:MAG: LytTR family transcriptional regulator [Bacteroidales bacterium]|nr:LytTR family transcriptional regulator [Candidatus Cacconaster equi]